MLSVKFYTRLHLGEKFSSVVVASCPKMSGILTTWNSTICVKLVCYGKSKLAAGEGLNISGLA
jgi:hypothetical protein